MSTPSTKSAAATSAKKAPKASEVKPLAIKAAKLLAEEEQLMPQKKETAETLYALVGSAEIKVGDRRLQAVKRKRTIKATGEEREEFLLKTVSKVSELEF